MTRNDLRIFAALFLSATLLVACARERPAPPPAPPPTPAPVPSPVVASESPASPEPSPAIVVPRPAMKSVNSEARPLVRNAPADPLLPTSSETPRFPSDFVIGPVGGDGGDQGADRFAIDFLSAMAREEDLSKLYTERGRVDAPAMALLLATLLPASPRAGSGVIGEGEASFLVRFVGKERSTQGELHLIRSGSSWLVDALILDEPVDDYGADGTSLFDPFTYTHFL